MSDLSNAVTGTEENLPRTRARSASQAPIAVLRSGRRVWAVGAVHGEAGRLRLLGERLVEQFAPGDRLVFLGNYLGYGGGHGEGVRETVDILLSIRRAFLSRPPFVHLDDVVFLRGCQEEMLRCLLELQFAVEPGPTLEWMLDRGAGATIIAYGGDPEAGLAAARDGPRTITRWTSALRDGLRQTPGHAALFSSLHWACCSQDQSLLFVSTGLDSSKPIGAQSDSFWWAGRSFGAINAPYGAFAKIVRGYDPLQGGFAETPYTVTIDGGSGLGGHLLAVCLSPEGAILSQIAA
jgi:serine/threonine protein phosphatase 1